VNCSNCGQLMPDEKMFCANCGSQQRPIPAALSRDSWAPQQVSGPAPTTTTISHQPGGAPASAGPHEVTSTDRTAAACAIVGGLLIAIGSVLPWATVTVGFATVNISGLDKGKDGVFTLPMGVIAVLLGILLFGNVSRNLGAAISAIGAVAGAVGVSDLVDITNRVSNFKSELGSAGVGAGLYLVVVGAAAAMVSGIGIALAGRR